MFVLYAYECPILSAYTLQQSRDIPSVINSKNEKSGSVFATGNLFLRNLVGLDLNL